MKRHLYLALGATIFFLGGCEEGEGTQIGNEGVVTEPVSTVPVATDPTGCDARTLPGSTELPNWPASLDGSAQILIGNLDTVVLDDGVLTTDGMLTAEVRGYRFDSDCTNVLVDVDLTFSFGSELRSTLSGELAVPASAPTRAIGDLVADDWTGDLVRAPATGLNLILDTRITATGLVSDLVLETCDGDLNCTEEDLATIASTD